MGEFNRRRVTVGPKWKELHELRLLEGGLTEFTPSMTDLTGEEACKSVENLFSMLVIDECALASNNNWDIFTLVVLSMLGEAHPEILPSVKFQFVGSHWLSNLSEVGQTSVPVCFAFSKIGPWGNTTLLSKRYE
jgi:hypothetical protein